MPVQIAIQQDLMSDGISLAIRQKWNGSTGALVVTGFNQTGPEDGLQHHTLAWAPAAEPGLIGRAATFGLSDEVARALLDALLRYYQGASDMHTVRADLLHERGRVDKLTDNICFLAGVLAGPPPPDRLTIPTQTWKDH